MQRTAAGAILCAVNLVRKAFSINSAFFPVQHAPPSAPAIFLSQEIKFARRSFRFGGILRGESKPSARSSIRQAHVCTHSFDRFYCFPSRARFLLRQWHWQSLNPGDLQSVKRESLRFVASTPEQFTIDCGRKKNISNKFIIQGV